MFYPRAANCLGQGASSLIEGQGRGKGRERGVEGGIWVRDVEGKGRDVDGDVRGDGEGKGE